MNKNQDKYVNKEAETQNKPKVTLDTILVNEIGQFGRFQLRTIILAAILTIFTSWRAFEYVFTTARINHRCLIPECDRSKPEWTPNWLANAIPATGSDVFDNCQRFANANTSELQPVESNTCPSTLFDNNTLQYCDKYVYENTNSVVYDFELACDEWRRSLFGTIRVFGIFLAQPITGFVSDRWGRRIALMTFYTGFSGILRYWSNNYIGFMMSQFFETTFAGASYTSFYILLMETMGPKYRVAGGAAMNTFFSIGQLLLGFIAWGVPNWRTLTLTLYIPQFITVFYYWFIFESVRWYMSKGRFDEADAVLKKIAKINGTQVSDESLQALRDTAMEEANLKAMEDELKGKEPWLIVQVFQHKRILLRCIISPVWWVTSTFIYYGLSINAVNLSGNRYLNFVAVSAVEIPGFWTAVILLEKIGRKTVLIFAFWLCAACQIAYIFVPLDLYGVSLTIYLIAKFAIAMVMTSIYVYTAELYPTKHRQSLFAYSSMIGRIGSMVAPLTPAIGAQWFEELPFVLFGCFALISGALVFLTPETRNVKLPDTFEEASQIGLKGNDQKRQSVYYKPSL